MIRCSKCGNTNPDDNNFCDQCGCRLSNIPGNTDSAKYANNPFESSNSSTNNNYNNPFKTEETKSSSQSNSSNFSSQSGRNIKRCSVCNGTGTVRKQVPSLVGKSFITETCSKCHGVGKYAVDQDGIFLDYSLNNNSNYNSQRNNASGSSSNSMPRPKGMTIRQSNILAAVLLGGIFFLYIISLLFNDSDRDKKNTKSVSETTTETSLDIEFTTVTYNDLSIEIPSDWVEAPLSEDFVSYGDSASSPTYCLTLRVFDGDITDESYRNGLIENFQEDFIDTEYTDISIDGRYALLMTYISNGTNVTSCFIDDEDGFISLSFYYPIDSDDFVPIIECMLDSCSFGVTEENTPDIEYTTFTDEQLTFELPSNWIDDGGWYYQDEVGSDCYMYLLFSDGNDITQDNYFFTTIQLAESYNISVEYEYLTIDGYYAFKLKTTDYSYEYVETEEEYYIDYNGWDNYNGGYYLIIFNYPSDKEDSMRPVIDNLINSLSVDNPFESIEFVSTTYQGMTYEYPAYWEIADDTNDSYVYTDPDNSSCSFSVEYSTEYTSVKDEDFKSWFFDMSEEPDCTAYVFSNIDNHNAAKLSFENDNQISTEYYVGSNEGLIHIVFSYPSEGADAYMTYMSYILKSCVFDSDEIIPEGSSSNTNTTSTTEDTSNKYAYYGSDTYYIIDLDKNKVYNFFTFDTDPYVGTCSGNLESGLTVTYNLDGDYVTETIYWSGSGDSQICVIDSNGFDWYYNKTSYSSAAAVMD